MMIKSRSIFFLIFLCTFFEVLDLNAQRFNDLKLSPFYNVNFKKDNSRQIKPIRDLFLKYNLVLLAESTHYDGATIDAQCMIMKELIDSGVINTIYTESSWLNAETIMSILLKEGKSGVEKAKKYAASGELIDWIDNDFWDYLTTKIIERKVRLVGFDIETTAWPLMEELFNEALSKIPELNLMDSIKKSELKEQYTHFENFVQLMSFSGEQYENHREFIKRVKKYYADIGDQHREHEWEIIESYLYWIYNRQFSSPETKYEVLYKGKYNINISYFNSIRDSIMAKIFIDDYSTNRNMKAIIKTSSYHALTNYKENSQIGNVFVGKNVHIFNDILNQQIPGQIYSICFVASSGEWGLDFMGKMDTRKIKVPKKSFEYFFKKSESPYFFSSFLESFDRSTSFIMKVVFQKPILAKWAQIFSGVFYIKEMYPIKYLYPEKHQIKNIIQ